MTLFTPSNEGWGDKRPGDRVYHFYRDGTSLCRKVGFYFEELTPDTGKYQKYDCKACTKVLTKEGKRPAEARK